METNKKQYGLILPQKTSQPSAAIVKKLSAFADSDDEEESSVDWMKKTLQKETYGNQKCRPSKLAIEKALREDPTVYSYDEVYDEMKKEQNKHVETKKTVDRKPKYMQCLLAQAAKRKQEDERRKERQIQKEREAEGDQFADKESFVTSAYKKKLEEMKQMDAEEQRQNMLENIGDVTKQPDISGFYHHLYKKLDSDDNETAPAETNEFQKLRDKLKRTDESKNTNRQYRAHVSESSSSDEESQSTSKVRRRLSPSTLESAKRRKIRESASLDDETGLKVSKDETTNENVTATESSAEVKTESLEEEKKSVNGEQTESGDDVTKEPKKPNESSSDDESNEEQTEQIEEKPKRSIWVKRTVGEVFEQALLRYLERKASRLVSEVV